MVDLDKFICSLIKRYCEANFIDRSRIRCWLDDVLEDCGVEYKDGALKPIKKEVKLKEGKWYVFTHASLFYDTINGEVVFKKDKPYRCLGEATLLGDGGDYCFKGQEDILKNLRPATDEEIKEIEKPSTIKFDEPDFERMEAEYCTTLDTPNGVIDVMIQSKMCSAYRQGLEDMWNKLVYKEV